MGKKKVRNSLIISLIILLFGCEESYIPKPLSYYRIDLPTHDYKKYESDCPFILHYQKGAFVLPGKGDKKCWLNLIYPKFNATLHLSYKEAVDAANVQQFKEESRSLVYKHTVKASGIREYTFDNDSNHVNAIIYELSGEAASPVQFNITDNKQHFFRGALYFNHAPNEDSLAPVITFIKEDIKYLVEHFEWKEN